MEVKRVYLGLHEGVRKGNVWKLESEAFKEPITLQIEYEKTDLQKYDDSIDGLLENIKAMNNEIDSLKAELKSLKDKQEHLFEGYISTSKNISELSDNIMNNSEMIDVVSKQIKNVNNTLESQSGVILRFAEQFNEYEKKITKQPTIYSGNCFLSGNEMVGLEEINVPDGEYLIISKFVVGEHNEYVKNKDEILFERVNVEGGYIPRYELQGGTELDTPTATIYYDLVFIPC